MPSLKELLYKTAHRNRKPLKQLADETGISENYLYRACLPVEGSGANFPLDKLLPLMKATNDYSVLSHLANLSGFILVKQPRFKNTKGETADIYDNYQEVSVNALKAMKDFFKEPTKANKDILDEALLKVIEDSASNRKFADKYYNGQPDLF